MNGDGRADLVISIYEEGVIAVVLGNGDGTFGAASRYPTGNAPRGIAIGDFNNDGRKDVAVTNFGSNSVSVLLGTGNGLLAPAVNYSVGRQPLSIETVDLNKDGRTDLVVTNEADTYMLEGGISVLLGNGDGTFTVLSKVVLGYPESGMAVADFNSDGNADLALTNIHDDQIAILLGNGDGTFHAGLSFTGGHGVQTADFNHDGKADLIMSTSNGPAVVFGNGDGTFSSPVNSTSIIGGPGPIADLNGDGNLDVVAGSAGRLVIALGNATGTFQIGGSYSIQEEARGEALGDFDGDGHGDLVIVSYWGRGCLWFLRGRGNGTFEAPIALDAAGLGGYPVAVTVGDFDANGVLDVAVLNASTSTTGSFSVLLGQSDGTFESPAKYGPFPLNTTSPMWWAPATIAAVDVNGDGRSDVVITPTDSVAVYLSNVDGSLAPPISVSIPGGPVAIASGDFNRDGRLDLATANAMSNEISILLGTGDAHFTAAVTRYQVGTRPSSIIASDFNKDGKTDLAVANSGSGDISVLRGSGNGTFSAAETYTVANMPVSIATSDFNRDQRDDLVVGKVDPSSNGFPPPDPTVSGFSLLLGNGDGTFAARSDFASGGLARRGTMRSIVAEDFDGDGRKDVAMSNNASSTLSVFRGNGDGTFAAAVNFVAGSAPASIAVGDFDRDGRPDLVVASGPQKAVILENRSVCPPSNPTITALSAMQGAVEGGESLTISGSYLDAALSVTFGGVVALIVRNDSTSIRVVTPAHQAGSVDIVVITASGTVSYAAAYTYVAAPTVTPIPTVSYAVLLALVATLAFLAVSRLGS